MIAPASRKIGKYELRHKLGRGGMADVYLALDTERGHDVALKLIEHSADADTRDSIEAERRGAELQARLADVDPRVVRVYDCADADGYFYVAMEYIDGQDLAELMRGAPLMTGFATEVALAVANTLEHAHGLQAAIGGRNLRGVVHGDIKPRNIRIDAHGEVRVLDFGIAKGLSLSRRLTRNEFGSVPYASPERLDSGDVNFGSDLWSLGVMLYEMVAGVQPYHAETTERLERMIRSRIAPPPAPDPCPEPLRRILIKAMAPYPDDRYQSAREFAEDIEAFRSGRPVAAAVPVEDSDATRRTTRRSGEGAPTPDAASEATRRTTRPSPVPSTSQPAKRRWVFRATVRTIGILGLAGVSYASWVAVSNYFLYKHGQELSRQVESEQLTDPEQIWARWTELSQGNPSSLLLYGPRKVVKQKFVAEADRVIDTFRNNGPQQPHEKDWERARMMASHALGVDPDEGVRGKLRLAEGHLARINGAAHRSAPELNHAVELFQEAQRLLPKSPDPQLGLARVYYSPKDLEKADNALEEARRRGYPLGNPQKLQLADRYRDRGDRLWADSRNLNGLPPEKDQLQRVAADYRRALEIYQEIAPYGNANAAIDKLHSNLDSVLFRTMQIDTISTIKSIWR